MVVLLLVLSGALAYANSFTGVFVFDDGAAILENPYLKSLWPLTRAMTAPPETTVSGRPIASLTLAVNYALAPADARDVMTPGGPGAPASTRERFLRNIWGYHALNLTVHLLAAIALFGVARQTLERWGRRRDAPAWVRDRATVLAGVVAWLWVLHPLQTESVTYIIQRVEALMSVFYLTTLYCAIRALDTRGRRQAWWAAGAVAACACGMATKETMVTAPVMVALWDWMFREPGERPRRRALYAGLASTWAIVIAIALTDPRGESAGFGLGWPWWAYLATQAGILVHYLRLAIVPTPLVFDYAWPRAESLSAVAAPALLLIALFAGSVVAIVRRHPIGLAGAWFFLILAPTSSIVPILTEVAAEHRMYLPLAGVIGAVVIGAYAIGLRGLAGLAAATAVAVVFGWMTRERNRDYESEERLWLKTIESRPANPRARLTYAISLLTGRRYGEAEAQLREAIRILPSSAPAHMNLGIALCAQDRTDECIAHLENAARLDPRAGETFGLLGEAYLKKGAAVQAVAAFVRALDTMPDSRASRFLIGRVAWLLATSPQAEVRDGVRAIGFAERAVAQSGGTDLAALDALAAAYAEAGRFPDAEATIVRALGVAAAQGDAASRPTLESHLALVRAGKPIRSPH